MCGTQHFRLSVILYGHSNIHKNRNTSDYRELYKHRALEILHTRTKAQPEPA